MSLLSPWGAKGSRVRLLSTMTMLVALAAASRLLLQWIPNVSLVVTLTCVSGILFGVVGGVTVGGLSMLVSDLFIGPGPWTLFGFLFMGLVGGAAGMLWRGRVASRLELGILGFLLTLLFDVGTSLSSMTLLFGVPWHVTILALFLPVTVGSIPYPFGPVHELSNAILLSALAPRIVREAGRIVG